MNASDSAGWALPYNTPGVHTLSVRMKATIRHGPGAADGRAGPPLFSHDIVLTARPEVVTEEPPGYLKRVTAPAVTEAVRRCLQPLVLEHDDRGVGGTMIVMRAPVGLALDVFARAGGTEYPMGGLIVANGRSTNCVLRAEPFGDGPVNEIDMVLRSNPTLARQTK
jgi:hypothetical protein